MSDFDAIVVGARVAGAPTAMLLARAGHRVLLVDRVGFPSDKMSTHLVHAPGVLRLNRWGLLDRVRASGAPDITLQYLEQEDFTLRGLAPAFEGIRQEIGPRRTALDAILVEAAVEAGAELRERFTVDDLQWDDHHVVGIVGHARGGESVRVTADVVVGADGMHSRIAQLVNAPTYDDVPSLTWNYYSYWSGLDFDGAVRLYHTPGRIMGAVPTNDDLYCVFVQGAIDGLEEFRSDLEANFFAAADQSKTLGEQLRAGRREERFVGTGDVPNFYRRPYGAGWALVGDAGYHRDPVTAQGIMDAFQSAELLAEAIHAGLSGERTLLDALAEYEQLRNTRVGPFFGWTMMLAQSASEPMPEEVVSMFRALQYDQELTDLMFGMAAGVTRPDEFFTPEIMMRVQALNPDLTPTP